MYSILFIIVWTSLFYFKKKIKKMSHDPLSWFHNLLGGPTHNLKNTILYYIAGSKFSDTLDFFWLPLLFLCVGRNPAFSFPGNIWDIRKLRILPKVTQLLVVSLGHDAALGGSHVQGLSPMFYSPATRSFYTFQHGSYSGLCCVSSRKPHKVCRKDSAKLVKYRFNE